MDAKTLICFAMMAMKQGREKLACDILKHASDCENASEFVSYGQDGQGIDGLNSYVDEVSRRSSPAMIQGGVSPSDNTLAPSLHGNGDGGNSPVAEFKATANDHEALAYAVAVASSVVMQNRFIEDGDILLFDAPYIQAEASATYEKPLQPGRVRISL